MDNFPPTPTDGASPATGPQSGPVGTLIRQCRERRGLSLQQLGDRIGIAKSYLSAIENGHRPAPGDELLGKIEEALGLASGDLTLAGRWERGLAAGGAPIRRELERLQADQRAARRLAQLLRPGLHEGSNSDQGIDALYRTGELRRLVESLERPDMEPGAQGAIPIPLSREVPLINKVAAGYPREFTDLSYPARIADEYVRVPDIADPDAFAARVVGDSMEPAYLEGDIVIFSPAKPVSSGMDCFARLEPDHDTTFKRIYFEGPKGEEQVRLQPLNGKYPPRTLPRDTIAGLYAAVSVMRKIG